VTFTAGRVIQEVGMTKKRVGREEAPEGFL